MAPGHPVGGAETRNTAAEFVVGGRREGSAFCRKAWQMRRWWRLGLISDADVFAYYAETRFDILFRHYARDFWHIIPVLCRKFLKRRAWRADLHDIRK